MPAKKWKKHSIMSDILLSAGVLLLVAVIAYEAAYYPWGALLSSLGIMEARPLADPPPLPQVAAQVSAKGWEESVDTPAVFPEPQALGGFLVSRPAISVSAIGIIKIPAISISENLVEGGGDELFYGVGHIPGTSLPGQEGNCVLAGHRNYLIMHPFRHLDMMDIGDKVLVEYEETRYTYEVFDTFVVEADNLSVLNPQEQEKELLTLVTCTPVLSPTKRLIVWCRPVANTVLH